MWCIPLSLTNLAIYIVIFEKLSTIKQYTMRQLKITTQVTDRGSKVEKYLQEIGRISMVTIKEESILAQKIKAGDQHALEALVRANLRFVVSVAKQYQYQGLTLGDLINEGNLGLIKAARRFDETKGFKFISYAVWWIRQSILGAIAETGTIVRLPMNKLHTYSRANKAFSAFEQDHEREPTIEELSEILEIREEELANVLQSNTKHTSLDAPIYEVENVTVGDSLLKSNEHTDYSVMQDSLKAEVRRVLKTLSPREQEVLTAYFQLNGENSLSIEQLEKKYNVTRLRIIQIKQRALKRLRKPVRSSHLRAYLG